MALRLAFGSVKKTGLRGIGRDQDRSRDTSPTLSEGRNRNRLGNEH